MLTVCFFVGNLAYLKEKGKILAVASSKPEKYVEQILEHFEIRKYFTVVTGSEMNETRTDKGEVIAETLRRLGAEDSRSDVVMVGDRSYDVIGARENGLLCVGVSYGYGGREELEAAGAAKVCDTPEELKLLAEDPKEEKKRRDRIKKMKPERIPWLTRGESGTGIFALFCAKVYRDLLLYRGSHMGISQLFQIFKNRKKEGATL